MGFLQLDAYAHALKLHSHAMRKVIEFLNKPLENELTAIKIKLDFLRCFVRAFCALSNAKNEQAVRQAPCGAFK